MNELISVIIPVYNVEEYLLQCLETVCGQTYRSLEIILVDDGSTDRSGEICDAWALKDERIKVIHKENGGVSSARNEGLKAASGPLIGFVDSDDWLEPVMYEKLAAALGKTPGADIAVCGFVDYPYGIDVPVLKGLKPHPPCGTADTVTALFERGGYFTSLWNKLFRRSAVFPGGRMVPFETDLSFGEDEVWLVRVLRGCRQTVFVPEALYHWRPRAGSVTRYTGITEKQLSILKAKRRALKLLPRRKDVLELAEGRIFNDCYFLISEAYCTGDRAAWRKARRALVPMRKAWLKSGDVPKLRKAKVILMDMEMRLGMPEKVIRFTDGINKHTGKALKRSGTGVNKALCCHIGKRDQDNERI